MASSSIKGKDIADQHHHHHQAPADPGPGPSPSGGSAGAQPLSRYESQKRRDWNTFCQYLKNQRPPVDVMSECTPAHVLDFLRYLDQFGKTKVHHSGCPFFGQPDPPGPCTCPLKQAWGSLDALIGRLRAAYEENGGPPETNPFATGAIRVFLREVRDSQARARGVPYKKKKKRRAHLLKGGASGSAMNRSDGSSRYNNSSNNNPMQSAGS